MRATFCRAFLVLGLLCGGVGLLGAESVHALTASGGQCTALAAQLAQAEADLGILQRQHRQAQDDYANALFQCRSFLNISNEAYMTCINAANANYMDLIAAIQSSITAKRQEIDRLRAELDDCIAMTPVDAAVETGKRVINGAIDGATRGLIRRVTRY